MIDLLVLGCVAFIQNMCFTWVSRSRNSGDPMYHRIAAYFSNGVWFLTNILIWRQVWVAVETSNYGHLIIACFVYVLCSSEGSVLMMKHLIKTERGKRKVGA